MGVQVPADYAVKAGAVPGPLVVQLSFADGTLPDLTPVGTTAELRIRTAGFGGVTVLSVAMVITGPQTVSYDWQPGDLALPPGAYEAEIQVTWTSGKTNTFPTDPERPYLVFLIEASIAAVIP